MTLRSPGFLVMFLLTFGAGCGDADYAVSIDVRTDFSPANEFDAIQLTIDGVDERIVADRAASYLAGVRIYDGELAPGDHDVQVALTQSGRTVVSRRVLFRVDTDRGMTVVLTRRCANVMCGATTTCISGECVDPRCTPETPELCDDAPECAGDDECAEGVCGVATCVLRSCFQSDDGLCGADAFCDPGAGCQSRERDAGVGMDAMTGGRDATVTSDGGASDGGVGGFDSSVLDTEFDARPQDSGRDVPAPRDTGGPDVPGPSGDCRNPSDEAALDTYTVQRGINDGYGCYGTHGNNPALIQSCVQAAVGVSNMCADCFVRIVQCTIANCSSPCMNPAAPQCVTCRDMFCDPGFTSCSGFEI